jgi:hypothetical protein
VPKWEFRDIKEMITKGKKCAKLAPTTRKDFARNNEGIKGSPLFPIPLTSVIPCHLHAAMALIRLLMNKLAKEANGNEQLAKALEQRLESDKIGITMYPEVRKSDGNKKKLTFLERMQKTSLKRPELMKILVEQNYLLEALKHIKRRRGDTTNEKDSQHEVNA